MDITLRLQDLQSNLSQSAENNHIYSYLTWLHVSVCAEHRQATTTKTFQNKVQYSAVIIHTVLSHMCYSGYYNSRLYYTITNYRRILCSMVRASIIYGNSYPTRCNSIQSCYSLQPGHYSNLTAPNFQPTATQERDDQCGNQRYSRELLVMGIVVPETCRSTIKDLVGSYSSVIFSNSIQFIYICQLLYMFRVGFPTITRSSWHCIYSIWH